MPPLPTTVRIAQTLGITTSAFVAGSILSISVFSVPSLLLAPSPVLVRQWQLSFNREKIINPAIALVSAFSYFWLSWRLYGGLNHPKAEMYALSVICTLGVWPYTIFGMMPTNRKLFKKYDEMKGLSVHEQATEVGLAKGESAKELLDRWDIMFPDPIIWEARGLDAEFLSTLSPSLQNLILDEAAHAAGADNPDQFLHHYPAGKVRTCFLLDIVLTRLNREVDALREEREERREDMMLESLELNDVVLANPRAGSFPAYDDNPNPENFTTLLASKEEIASNLLPTYTHYLNSSGTHYLSYSDAPVYDSVQIKHKDGTNVKVEEIQEWVAKWWEGAPNVSTIGK